MDGIGQILTKTAKNTNKNIHSEAHYWADVISGAFGEKKKFALYLGIIKRVGVEKAKQIFAEIQDGNAASPAKLFLWRTSQKNINPNNETADNNRT